MVEADFIDLDSANAWFHMQSVRMRCMMTSRAALRVVANVSLSHELQRKKLALLSMWALLVSASRAMGPTADMAVLEKTAISARSQTEAAYSAHSKFTSRSPTEIADSFLAAEVAAHSAALSAASVNVAHRCALCLARSFNSTSYSVLDSADLEIQERTHSAAVAAASKDGKQTSDILIRAPIWGDTPIPKTVSVNHAAFLDYLGSDPDWAFFRRWYAQMWDGTFEDWDLAIEVATLDPDLWEGEDALARVAEAIREIEARQLVERLPQVEEVFKTEAGLYDVRGTISEPCKLLDSVCDRVRFAFDLAVQSNACDLNEMSVAAKLLRHALEDCRDDPNAMEQFFRQAGALIKGGIERGIFGEDDTLYVLTRTLDEVALQMRSDHPEVAAAVDGRTKQALREMDDAKRLDAAQMIEDLREGTTARLNTELALAVETTRDGSSEDATADSLKQSGNRAAKISMAERAKQAEGSGAMASIKMALRADKIVDFITSLFSGGGAV
ncbi:MAG: hypothetical protein AAFY75_14490 [Pseudomonadota bacterium]